MIPPWWGHGAADIAPSVQDDEGGPLYPPYGHGNNSQLDNSVYHRAYPAGTTASPLNLTFSVAEQTAQLERANVISTLVHYMMVKMEPTDRCLRPPGDIYYPPDWKHAREIDGKWVVPDGE